jgi:hypothetical protein
MLGLSLQDMDLMDWIIVFFAFCPVLVRTFLSPLLDVNTYESGVLELT